MCCLFDNSHSDKCEVVSHRGFGLLFPDNLRYWTFFHTPVGLGVFFGQMSIRDLSPFFNWVVCLFLRLSCTNSMYVLDINSLSNILFANIFYHSVGGLFVLVVFLHCEKAFSLTGYRLFIFAYISFAWAAIAQKILLRPMPKIGQPMICIEI